MEEFRSSPDEINSIDYLNKKRKLENELLELPLPKHICCGQNKVESEKFVIGSESDPESARDSNSFHSNEDSIMSNDEESDTFSGYRETCSSDEPSTSSVSWGSSSSETLSSKKSVSISEHLDSSDYKFGSDSNGTFSEYSNDGIEQFKAKELENLLYSNGVASSEYVLSSGRWTVNRGNLEA